MLKISWLKCCAEFWRALFKEDELVEFAYLVKRFKFINQNFPRFYTLKDIWIKLWHGIQEFINYSKLDIERPVCVCDIFMVGKGNYKKPEYQSFCVNVMDKSGDVYNIRKFWYLLLVKTFSPCFRVFKFFWMGKSG